MNRRHFLLSSLGTTLALPSMSSLLAKGATGGSVQVAKGAGLGARRFVAIGYLLGYLLNDWIASYDRWVAFGLLLAVGAYMIREALQQNDADEVSEPSSPSFWPMLLASRLPPSCCAAFCTAAPEAPPLASEAGRPSTR